MRIKGGVASHGQAIVDSQGRLLVDIAGGGGGGNGAAALEWNTRAITGAPIALNNVALTLIDLPVEVSQNGTSITWNAGNTDFDISESGSYLIGWQGTSDGAAHTLRTQVTRNVGAGHAAVPGAIGLCGGGGVIRGMGSGTVVLNLVAGDSIGFSMSTTAVAAVNAIAGCHMTIMKVA